MTSLRSRLILGSSLIAVIPLAVAMFLLSQRIETMVRTQAAARLNAALAGLQHQLGTDGQRIADQIEILGRDPQLKRLYLVRPAGSRDLSDYLAERRFLLGLDFLLVADTSGGAVADGSTIASGMTAADHDRGRLATAGRRGSRGLAIEGRAGDSGLAVVASAPIRYEHQTAGVVHGGTVIDAAFLVRLRQTSGVELVLRDSRGRAVATTLGDAGSRAGATTLADTARPDRSPHAIEHLTLAGASYLSRSFPLEVGPPPHAGITGLVSTAPADRTIATLQMTSLLLGLLALALAVVLGVLWSSQISRPVERLAAFSRRLAQGEWDEALTLRSVGELQTLVAALDRMRSDLRTYRDRLVTSERQAAWSQMARTVAHEIKNPLTPIAVSVADLKRSFDQERPDFPQILDQAVRTIGDEIETLRRLLQEFSDFGRFPAPRLAPCRLGGLFTDLAALYARDIAEGRLAFTPPDREITFSADVGQIRHALVNLIKNGLEALEGGGRVVVSARGDGDALAITVADTGPGLSAEQKAHLFVPGFTTKTRGSGLGLTIVERIVNDHQGTIALDAGVGNGTTFRIRLPLAPAPAAMPAPAEPREP